ncbi:TonB-dependent receptor plug domain-containing protein [Zoogloea sp.]|uniref:TonB-dependent receptor n=1 Tax=Zoogloea sp. TaxID=49181 RepID=UPI001ACA25D0|nr:TonB-dependent receptor plug domain-containing protein [Zoogloea sp.]MBN8285332.1 TonB-dependent receptor [Zoogloea sp.]
MEEKLRRTPLAILMASLWLCPGHAAAESEKILPTITVSSSSERPELTPENARNPFRTPKSSTVHTQVITREEIEQLRPRDVFELLNSATGVIATQSSRKGFSGLTIRGDSQFRWIIDGAYLQPTMASRIMKSLPVSAIEEIKIVRGASTLTMGPMAGSASPGGAPVDGFVVIRTRKPARDEVQLRAAVESNDTTQANVWAGKAFGQDEASGKGYVAGLLSYAENGSPDELLDNGASYNVDRQTTGGLLKGGFQWGGWLIDVMAYKDDGEFQIPNANSHGTGNAGWYMDPSRTDVYSMTGSKAWGGIHTTLFSLSRSVSKQAFWTANTAAGPYTSRQNDNEVTHLNLRHNIDIGNTRLTAGGDYMHWDAPNGQQYYEGIQREEKTKSWFVQAEQGLFDNKLSLDASYRRDQVHVVHGLDYYTGGNQPPGGVNSPLIYSNRTLPSATFFSLGASWAFFDQWRLSGRYGQSSQATTGLNPRPGVELTDDSQRKWEIGVEGHVTRWLNPSLNYFRRSVENEKFLNGYTYLANNNSTQTCRTGIIPSSGAFAPKSSATMTPCYDQQDTLRGGVELVLTGAFAERSFYRFGLTHFTTLENTLATTPRNIVDLSFSHGMGSFTLSGAIKHVASYQGSSSDVRAYLGGYTRYDLGLGYEFKLAGAPVRATLYGRNLTNEKYETSNGVQDVGRVFGLETTVSF